MVGDGINDAPALAQADVGHRDRPPARDVAIEASDVTLIRGDLRGVVTAIRAEPGDDPHGTPETCSGRSPTNVVGIPVAAGLLYPVLGWSASAMPLIASAAMSFSSVSVCREQPPPARVSARPLGLAGDPG